MRSETRFPAALPPHTRSLGLGVGDGSMMVKGVDEVDQRSTKVGDGRGANGDKGDDIEEHNFYLGHRTTVASAGSGWRHRGRRLARTTTTVEER